MGNEDKTRIITIIEFVMISVGIISLFGLGIYRDSLDQYNLNSRPEEERKEIFEKLGPVKIGFGVFIALFFFVWLLLTILLYQGLQMKSFCRVKAWVILQTIIYTFVMLGLMKEYSNEFYMNYKSVQLVVFLLYRIWSLYIVWNLHHELIKLEQERFQVIEYSRSPTAHTPPPLDSVGGGQQAIMLVEKNV